MEYKAVSGSYAEALTERVNALLKQGFKLQGGVAVGQGSSPLSTYVVQALVKDAQAGGKRSGAKRSMAKKNTKRASANMRKTRRN